MPNSLRHVLTILAVDELDRAVTFYETALELEPCVRTPSYVEFTLPGGQRLGMYQREGFALNTGQAPVRIAAGELTPTELYFHCEHLEETMARVRQAGARELSPLSVRDWGDEAAYFADPSGNVVVLARELGTSQVRGAVDPEATARRFTRTDSRRGPKRQAPEPTPNVPIRTGELDFEAWSEGGRFGGRELRLSRRAGAEQVHVNLMVVPTSKQSCPFHYHLREEEHFFVLEGSCIMRSGEQRFTVRAGDYVCFPAGTGVGHAFENPFERDCTMLALGPEDSGEIAVYPDSGKAKLRAAATIVPWPQPTLDYWQGEPVDEPVDEG